jgi:putative addiction module component (TIGR02574 family)
VTISIRDIDYSQLTLNERTLLMHDLAESIRTEADAQPLSPEFRAELNRRMAEIDAGTVPLLSWDAIRASVFGLD